MRKLDDRENGKLRGEREGKMMTELMATNVFTSLLPEQQPTATPNTRAKML